MKTLNDVARAAGYMTLPPEGAWVCVMGVPIWPIGKRLIAAHREIGIQHMDVYWASNEVPVAEPRGVNRKGRRNRPLMSQMHFDIMNGKTEKEAFDRVVGEYRGFMGGAPFVSPHRANSMQSTYITIVHPYPEEVRFFNCEIRTFTSKTIQLLLADGGLETIFFGQSSIPILEGAVGEIVDALQVDGMTRAEAYHMALTGGVIQPDDSAQWIPSWFYRSSGAFRKEFCEEEGV